MELNDLRLANIKRQKEWPGDEFSTIAFRALEIAGEAGELAEAVKKYLRMDLGIMGSTNSIQDIANEMGDVIISIDLLAGHLGIYLDDAVTNKFNLTSEKYGLKTKLGD